jgi:hypothetical protein
MNLDESAPPPTYIGTMVKTSPTTPLPQKNKGCVALWPCHLHFKSIYNGEERIMETQIFHHAKI